MPEIDVVMMQSFVDADTGGNPAGVVFGAKGLTYEDKLFIAASVGVSETAFISKSKLAAFKLEFFTPQMQLPHCGHATVASFCYLAQKKLVKTGWTSKETIDGKRNILITDGMAFMQQLNPTYQFPADKDVPVSDIMASLVLSVNDLIPGLEPVSVHTGNRFLMVPLKDLWTLKNISPDYAEINDLSKKLDVHGFYPFSTETVIAERDASARMFAPYVGICEEAATGTASGPLAGFLYDYLGIKKDHIVIEQGRLMEKPSPSVLYVDLQIQQGQITGMMVGGKAVQSGQKYITW